MIGFTGGRIGGSGKRTGRGHDFGGLARYLVYGKAEGEESRGIRATSLWTRNLATDDPEIAARLMAAHAAQNPRVTEPVMHTGVSLPPGESLTREQWETVADRILGALREERGGHGIDPRNHQAVCAIHQDGPQQHLHIMLNRVGPDGETWKGSWNFPKVERALRSLEREFGLQLVAGRHQDRERFAGARDGLTEGESRARARGRATWSTDVLERQGSQLGNALRESRSWRELEDRLNGLGLHLRPSGRGGLVLTDGEPGHTLKLSRVGRASSGPALERRFGSSFQQWRAEHDHALYALRHTLGQWAANERGPLTAAAEQTRNVVRGELGRADARMRDAVLCALERAYGGSVPSACVALDTYGPHAIAGALRHAPRTIGPRWEPEGLPPAIAAARRLATALDNRPTREAQLTLSLEARVAYGCKPGEEASPIPLPRDAAAAAEISRTLRQSPDTYGRIADPAALDRAASAADRLARLEACRPPAAARAVAREERETLGLALLAAREAYGYANAADAASHLHTRGVRAFAAELAVSAKSGPAAQDAATAAQRLVTLVERRPQRLAFQEFVGALRTAYERPAGRDADASANFWRTAKEHGRARALTLLASRPETFGRVVDLAAVRTAVETGWRLDDGHSRTSLHAPRASLTSAISHAQRLWGRANQLPAIADEGMSPEATARELGAGARRAVTAATRALAVALPPAASKTLSFAGSSLGSGLTAIFGPDALARELLQLATQVGLRTLAIALPQPAMAVLQAATTPFHLGVSLSVHIARTMGQGREH